MSGFLLPASLRFDRPSESAIGSAFSRVAAYMSGCVARRLSTGLAVSLGSLQGALGSPAWRGGGITIPFLFEWRIAPLRSDIRLADEPKCLASEGKKIEENGESSSSP